MKQQALLKFISRLFIAFGVLLINLFLFSIIAEYTCTFFYQISISEFLSTINLAKPNTNEINALRLFQGLVSIGTFIFSSLILALIFKQKPLEYLGLRHFPNRIYLLLVPCLLLISMPLLSWLIELNGQLTLPSFMAGVENTLKAIEAKNEKMYAIMLTMTSYDHLIANIFVMALIPAIGEELFCRGVLLNIYYDYSGKFIKSVIIVALIFTLFHMQVYKFIPMMALAILLGLLIGWTQSIWASILFHFLNNTMAVIGSYYNQKGIKNFMTDNHEHVPYVLTLFSFLLTVALIAWITKFAKRQTQIIHE